MPNRAAIRWWIPALALLLVGAPSGAEVRAGDTAMVDAWLEANLAELVDLYRHLHAHPELSLQEAQTAARVARELERAGFSVETDIGGHGVAAVLANGTGPTVMIRGDTDALPVREETGLPYASRVEAERPDGTTTGVMHACGHDVHTSVLIATGRLLAERRAAWSGTLVLIGEPAEEIGRGARAMMDDGLFERVPRPDYALALHVEPALPAGKLGFTPEWSGANVDSVDITIYGRGGHGARPHQAVDPITAAAYLVTQLQTLVSRRVDPLDPAVVSVGSIHGGHKHNIIPDEVRLQLTVRSYSDDVRRLLLDGIRQLARDTCKSFQCPREPLVETREHYTPAVYNDPALMERGVSMFRRVFGEDHVVERPPSMGGDDFGRFPKALGVPGMYFRVGATEPGLHRASREPGGAPLPSLHSSRFAPDARPTLRTGVSAMSHLALELFDRP